MITKFELVCLRCGNVWMANAEIVNWCPKCKDVNYDLPKDKPKYRVNKVRGY
jgi:predicted  nucleic acid-binding Zn-ribbon protein